MSYKEAHQGFDNPVYLLGLEEKIVSPLDKKSNRNFASTFQTTYLNNLINSFETSASGLLNSRGSSRNSYSSSSEVMSIYEDILDLNPTFNASSNQVLSESSSSSILSSSSTASANKLVNLTKKREEYKNR